MLSLLLFPSHHRLAAYLSVSLTAAISVWFIEIALLQYAELVATVSLAELCNVYFSNVAGKMRDVT